MIGIQIQKCIHQGNNSKERILHSKIASEELYDQNWESDNNMEYVEQPQTTTHEKYHTNEQEKYLNRSRQKKKIVTGYEITAHVRYCPFRVIRKKLPIPKVNLTPK